MLAGPKSSQTLQSSKPVPTPEVSDQQKPTRPRLQGRKADVNKIPALAIHGHTQPNVEQSSRRPQTRRRQKDLKQSVTETAGLQQTPHPETVSQSSTQAYRGKQTRTARSQGTKSDASTTPSTPAFSRDNLSCPICIEKFEEMELRFHPCPCGYRVCAMCIHLIKEKADGKCPSCREEYSSDRVRVEEKIPKGLLTVFRQASREEELEAKRAAKKAALESYRRQKPLRSGSYREKELGSLLTNLKSMSLASTNQSTPTVSFSVPPPPPPPPVVKMTRFTGGLSVWD